MRMNRPGVALRANIAMAISPHHNIARRSVGAASPASVQPIAAKSTASATG